MSEKPDLKIWTALFLPLVVSYFYVLNGDFLGDDINRILFNPELKSFYSSFTGGLADRPLLMLYVKLIVQFFGVNTIAFRVIGLALHALVAGQLYLFILDINAGSKNKNKQAIALLSASIFAIHPIHNEVLTMSIQAGVLLSGFFGILSLRYFYKDLIQPTPANTRRSLGYFVLGLLSKPNISFIPLFFLIQARSIKSNVQNKIVIVLAFIATLLIPTFFYLVLKKNIQEEALSPIKYFLVQTEVLFTYFKLMTVPYNFHFLYDFATPGLSGFSIHWVYLLIHLAIISAGYLFLKNRTLFVLLVGFYLSFLPESGFFPINHLAFEHRTYFPMIFLFLFIGTALMDWRPKDDLKNGLRATMIGLSALFILLNQNRNIDIKRYGSWALDTLEHSHSYPYSNFMFTYLLARSGYDEELKPLLKTYSELYKDKDYEILDQLVALLKDKNNKWNYYPKLREYLNRPSLKDYSRLFLNKAIVEEFSNGNDNIQDLIVIEDTLGDELKYLLEKKDINYSALSNFQTLGNHLLSTQLVSEYRNRNLKSYVRTKAFLYLYFDQNFKDLAAEIQSAITKFPDDINLKELISQVRAHESTLTGK